MTTDTTHITKEGLERISRVDTSVTTAAMCVSIAIDALRSARAAELSAQESKPVEEIRAEAAKPKVSGTGRMGAPHRDDCTCRQCTDREIAKMEEYARLTSDLRCNGIRADLERMIASAEVFIDAEDAITGYKVKTGALHRLFGQFAQWGKPLVIPSNLPVAAPSVSAQDASPKDVLTDGCEWSATDDGLYETSCGHAFETDDGTAEENGFKFCCFCGKTITALEPPK